LRKDFKFEPSGLKKLIQILGFNEEGKITNYDKFGKQSWEQILDKSVKILNFYDMGGSEKALKTTVEYFKIE
jgi:hypothetical protein